MKNAARLVAWLVEEVVVREERAEGNAEMAFSDDWLGETDLMGYMDENRWNTHQTDDEAQRYLIGFFNDVGTPFPCPR